MATCAMSVSSPFGAPVMGRLSQMPPPSPFLPSRPSMALAPPASPFLPSRPSMSLAPPAGLHGLMQGMVASDARIENTDPADPLDQVLLVHLQRVARELPEAKLSVRRLGKAWYEVDGRRVFLRLGISKNFARDRPLVREQNPAGTATAGAGGKDDWLHAEEHDLLPYLRQAANVTRSLRGSAISRIPKDLRVSFVASDAPGGRITLKDIRMGLVEDGEERCQSMRLACEQAHLREMAASMYEKQGPFWRSFNHNLGFYN